MRKHPKALLVVSTIVVGLAAAPAIYAHDSGDGDASMMGRGTERAVAPAVDMARQYNANPQAANLVLKRLNLDIIVDQSYEIGFLEQIVERFPGNPDVVEIDDTIPGMEGMPMGEGGDGSMKGMDHGTQH